jgi:hypothetical protein
MLMSCSGGEGRVLVKRVGVITGTAAEVLKHVQTAHSGFKVYISTIAGVKLSSHKAAN